jgi:hypothetical protein
MIGQSSLTATKTFVGFPFPALKGRAKFMPPLRVEEFRRSVTLQT